MATTPVDGKKLSDAKDAFDQQKSSNPLCLMLLHIVSELCHFKGPQLIIQTRSLLRTLNQNKAQHVVKI